MCETEIKQIFTILDDLEENLDTPLQYFVFVRESFENIFGEALRLNSTIMPSLLISEFVGTMQEYGAMAPSEASSEMFYMYADIGKMVLSDYLGDIFTLEDRCGQISCN